MDIAFLLGAGFSSAAGIPSSEEITREILFGSNISELESIRIFMKELAREVEIYYGEENHPVSYEDIYFMLVQIYDDRMGEYENPALHLFLEATRKKIDALGLAITPLDFIIECKRYISQKVEEMVRRNRTCLGGLSIISSAFKDKRLAKIDLFTLNHDLLIENYISEQQEIVADGFSKVDEDWSEWRIHLLQSSGIRARLVKLHGSVDWYHDKNSDGTHVVKKPLRPNRYIREMGEPLILIGTFNKILGYSTWFFHDLYCLWSNILRGSQALVVMGYSFRDKGINTRLIELIQQEKTHKMVVIHPDPESLKQIMRNAVSKLFDNQSYKSQLDVIAKRVECVSWEEIAANLK